MKILAPPLSPDPKKGNKNQRTKTINFNSSNCYDHSYSWFGFCNNTKYHYHSYSWFGFAIIKYHYHSYSWFSFALYKHYHSYSWF